MLTPGRGGEKVIKKFVGDWGFGVAKVTFCIQCCHQVDRGNCGAGGISWHLGSGPIWCLGEGDKEKKDFFMGKDTTPLIRQSLLTVR